MTSWSPSITHPGRKLGGGGGVNHYFARSMPEGVLNLAAYVYHGVAMVVVCVFVGGL